MGYMAGTYSKLPRNAFGPEICDWISDDVEYIE